MSYSPLSSPVKDVMKQYLEKHLKFNRACDQISLLQQRVKDVQVRQKRAIKNNKHSFSRLLKQRLVIMSSVKSMFHEYAARLADQMDELRTEMEDDTTDSELEDMSDSEEETVGFQV